MSSSVKPGEADNEESANARTSRPARRVTPLSWTAVGAITASLLLVSLFLLLRLTSPSDGARVRPVDQSVWRPNGIVVTPVDERPGGLRRGDLVIALDGRSLRSLAQELTTPAGLIPKQQVGQTSVYTVVRDGQVLDVLVPLEWFSLTQALRQDWGNITVALLGMLIGSFIFLRRPGNPAAIALCLISISGFAMVTWAIGLEAGDFRGGVLFWLCWAPQAGGFIPFQAAALHFSLTFPGPRPVIERRRWLIPAAYGLGYTFFLLGAVAVHLAGTSALEWFGLWSRSLGVSYGLTAVVVTAAVLSA